MSPQQMHDAGFWLLLICAFISALGLLGLISQAIGRYLDARAARGPWVADAPVPPPLTVTCSACGRSAPWTHMREIHDGEWMCLATCDPTVVRFPIPGDAA